MSTAPTLGAIKRTTGIAGQIAYSTTIKYEGEEASTVTFVGSTYGGPVTMLIDSGVQVSVTDPGQYGPFSPEWVRRFFA